jgi:hypothetical protein
VSRAALIAVVLLLVVPAAARAGTLTLGALAPPGKGTMNCGYDYAVYVPGPGPVGGDSPPAPVPAYTVPDGGGVITSWSVDDMNAGETVSLMITRFDSPYSTQIVERSAPEQVTTTDAVNTFPTHLPVQAGEEISLDVPAVGHIPRGCYWYTGDYSDFTYVSNDRVADGQSSQFTNGEGGFESSRVSVRATLDTSASSPPPPPPHYPGSACLVPKLHGLPLIKAKQLLAARSCRLGKLTRRRSRRMRAGRVIGQSPPPGTSLDPGGAVSLRIAHR